MKTTKPAGIIFFAVSLVRERLLLSIGPLLLMSFLTTNTSGTTLGAQWRKLPEEMVKPESGSTAAPAPKAGGNQWVQSAQDPAYAPVTFMGQFWADGVVQVSLGGVTVYGTNDDGSCNDYVETTSATVNLKLYQTYNFTLSGSNDVYAANGSLSAPGVLDLFSGNALGQQPERLYKLYIWIPDQQKWEILCYQNLPAWNLDACQPMSATFQIQVRPDLGARPVTRPGVMPTTGDDQGDDAWTRDEPAIDSKTAPGDGGPVKMSSSEQGDPASARFQWDVSLGRLWSGAGAGRLRIDESRFSTNVYTPATLNYGAPSAETNELLVLMDLDYTNSLAQVYCPQTLATIDPLYVSALLTTNDFLAVQTLVQQLTNHTDLVSGYLWTNFTSTGKQTLTNVNSTLAQLAATLTSEFNTILRGSSIYDPNRFAGKVLSGRTRRLLLLNPSGSTLIRLNRFLVEDAYPGEINRLSSTQFDISFYPLSEVGPVDSLGFYTLLSGASSFVTWQIGLPVGATNQWQVLEVRNGATNTTLLSWAPTTGCWTLSQGTGADARIETRTIVSNVVAGVTNAVETQQVSNGAEVVSDRTAEGYQRFSWGYSLVAATNDPGGAKLVTLFTFNTDTNDQATCGKIASITYPDGFWEQRVYSEYTDNPSAPYGSLIRIIQPWKNSLITDVVHSNLVADYAYNSGGPGTYDLQKWHGSEPDDSHTYGPDDYDSFLSRSTTVVYQEDNTLYLDTCAEDQGVVTEGRQLGNLSHYGAWQWTSSYTPYYGRLAGHLYSKEDQVGKLDSYDYEFGVWDPVSRTFTDYPQAASDHDVRQTIFHGTSGYAGLICDQITTGPSGSSIDPVYMEPYRATEEVRVIQGGNLVAKELYVYQGNFTSFAMTDQIIYQRDCLGHATNVMRLDPSTGQSRVVYQADWRGGQTWPTDLKLSETDQSGAVTSYTYDSLKRAKTQTKQPAAGQAALATAFSYDAAGRVLTNSVSGGTLSQSTVALYDLAGRLVQQTTPQLLTTSYSYQNGGQQTTITEPSGAVTTVSKYLDRRLASITGTAVTNQFFDYTLVGANTAGYLAPQNVTSVTLGSSNSLRWTASVTDARMEPAGDQRPAFNTTNILSKEFSFSATEISAVNDTAIDLQNTPSDPYDLYRGVRFETHYKYDFYGQRIGQSIAAPENPNNYFYWNLASNERITTWTNFYQQDGQGAWFHVAEQWSYPYSNDATTTLVERTKGRLTGFASTGVSETQKFDDDTNQTTVQVSVDLANKKLTTVTTVAQSSLSATQVVVNGLLQSESTTTAASPSLHYYDSLWRETGVSDPLGNLTQTQYDPLTGQVTATINAQGLRTTMQYYAAGGHAAGLLKSQTGPTGRSTYYDYNDRGQVTYVWGDNPYPEKREYNQFGDQTTLTTYRGGMGWNGSTWPASTGTGDVTTWFYDEATGLLTNKTDAAGQHVTFDYYNTHQLRTRIWARGVASTNIYRANGDFVRIDYSDGTSVHFTDDKFPYPNRLAKPAVILDNAGTSELTYDFAGRLRSTAYTAGLLAGITVTNHLNPVYGRDTLQVLGITPATTNQFTYDGYGRMGSVSAGIYSATYGYVPNSDLLQTTTCKNNASTILTTTRTWDYGYRLRSIANVAGGAVVTSRSYLYDWLDRRIQATLEDGSVWKYSYNDRNELIGAHRYWPDWTPVSGQQYGYDFDNIGNRSGASSGGDTTGANLRTTSYTANSLNQYTTVSTAGYKDILGAALATNIVTVNSGAADRKGEYFHREISVANGSGPLWQNASVTLGGNTTNGGFAFPGTNSALAYDADGNLTFDGIWAYEWDLENRLAAMSMTNLAGIANSNRLRLEFVYDFQGRRMSKAVKTWNGSAFASPVTTIFAFDGWNSLVELDPTTAVVRGYLWGQDLSGSVDGAGGIGGLHAVLEISSGTVSNSDFAGYDGNGNLTGLVRASDLATCARYEYSPFGETLRATGPIAAANPFRFSTKFQDLESGLLYYGYRFYSPRLGRWINRDPDEETAGDNLLGFVENNPIQSCDPFGKFSLIEVGAAAVDSTWVAADTALQVYGWYTRVKTAVETYEQFQQITSSILEHGFDTEDAEKLLMTASAAIAERLAGKMASKLAMQAAGRSGLARLIGTARDNLLGAAKNPRLKSLIGELYRDRTGKDIIGSGSAMDAYRYELATGKLLSPKGHRQKLLDMRKALMRVSNDSTLDTQDKQIIKDLLIDIQSAVSGG